MDTKQINIGSFIIGLHPKNKGLTIRGISQEVAQWISNSDPCPICAGRSVTADKIVSWPPMSSWPLAQRGSRHIHNKTEFSVKLPPSWKLTPGIGWGARIGSYHTASKRATAATLDPSVRPITRSLYASTPIRWGDYIASKLPVINWEEAPAEANYHAIDSNGESRFYVYEPAKFIHTDSSLFKYSQWGVGDRWRLALKEGPLSMIDKYYPGDWSHLWRYSLRKRPQSHGTIDIRIDVVKATADINAIIKEMEKEKPPYNPWINSPKKAKYWAVDSDGEAMYHRHGPRKDIIIGAWNKGIKYATSKKRQYWPDHNYTGTAENWENSLQKRPKTRPAPNWDKAPEWATFWVLWESGWGCWYEVEPFIDETPPLWSRNNFGERSEVDKKHKGDFSEYWKESLHKRPEPEPTPKNTPLYNWEGVPSWVNWQYKDIADHTLWTRKQPAANTFPGSHSWEQRPGTEPKPQPVPKPPLSLITYKDNKVSVKIGARPSWVATQETWAAILDLVGEALDKDSADYGELGY